MNGKFFVVFPAILLLGLNNPAWGFQGSGNYSEWRNAVSRGERTSLVVNYQSKVSSSTVSQFERAETRTFQVDLSLEPSFEHHVLSRHPHVLVFNGASIIWSEKESKWSGTSLALVLVEHESGESLRSAHVQTICAKSKDMSFQLLQHYLDCRDFESAATFLHTILRSNWWPRKGEFIPWHSFLLGTLRFASIPTNLTTNAVLGQGEIIEEPEINDAISEVVFSLWARDSQRLIRALESGSPSIESLFGSVKEEVFYLLAENHPLRAVSFAGNEELTTWLWREETRESFGLSKKSDPWLADIRRDTNRMFAVGVSCHMRSSQGVEEGYGLLQGIHSLKRRQVILEMAASHYSMVTKLSDRARLEWLDLMRLCGLESEAQEKVVALLRLPVLKNH